MAQNPGSAPDMGDTGNWHVAFKSNFLFSFMTKQRTDDYTTLN